MNDFTDDSFDETLEKDVRRTNGTGEYKERQHSLRYQSASNVRHFEDDDGRLNIDSFDFDGM
jgi:hypothetical protein